MNEFLRFIRGVFLTSIILFSFLFSIAQQSNFRPDNLAGLSLWLRSDSGLVLNGTKISQWNDCSSNHNNAVQSAQTSQPLCVNNVINGIPVVRFDGLNDFLSLNNEINTNDFTFFIVVKPADTIKSNSNPQAIFGSTTLSNALFIGFGDGTTALTNETFSLLRVNSSLSPYVHGAGITGNIPDNYHILDGILSNTSISIILDGISKPVITSTSGGFDSSTTYSLKKFTQIGSISSQWFFSGDIFEIIAYNTALTISERQNVENYLTNKYSGSPVNLGGNINSTNFCDSISLTAGPGFVSYLWSTGATTQNIITTAPGSYWIRAMDIFGTFSSDTINVAFPGKKLNVNDTTICKGMFVNLFPVNVSQMSSYNYLWSNGATDSSIVTSLPGNYWVKIMDNQGCYGYSDTVKLVVDTSVGIVSLGNDTSFCSGNKIVVNHPYIPGLNYLWNNGSTDSTLTITSSGSYWLKVTDPYGCFKMDTINIIITGTAPVSMFNADTVCLGDSTSFTDLSYCTFPDTINQWTWNFGDSAFSSIQNPEHLFSSPGIYNVQLTTAITSGCSQSAIEQVVVNPPSFAGFSADSSCINKPLQFINSGLIAPGDSVALYSWDFGDGSPLSHLFEPVHTYLTANTYQVILTLNTSKGCSTGITKTVIIKPNLASPQQVVLLTPAGGITLSDTLINFTWSSGTNAISYKFEIAPDSLFSTLIIARTLDTNVTSVILTSQGLIFWRVIAYNFCNDSSVSAVQSVNLFSLSKIQDLKLWLRSDSGVVLNGNNITNWIDFSLDHNSASQSSTSNQPVIIYNDIYGRPSVRFNGTSNYLLLSNEINTNDFSLYIVIKPSAAITNSTSGQVILGSSSYTNDVFVTGFGNNVGNIYLNNETFCMARYNSSFPSVGVHAAGTTSNISNNFHIINMNLSDTSQTTFNFDGIPQNFIISSSGNLNDTTIYSLKRFDRIGCVASQSFFDGNIAEIIIYNRNLTNTEKQNVENYLRTKYIPPPVNLGPDININYNFCDTVTLDASLAYSNYLWSNGATGSSIKVSSSGNYHVTVEDAFGNLSSDSVNVTFPSFKLNINDTVICSGNSINISTTSGSASYSLLWSNGSVNNFINASQQGSYWLTLTDSFSCHGYSDTVNITVDNFADQITLGNDTAFCSGNSIFVKHGNEHVQSYLWDNNSSDSSRIITSTGNYWVIATDSNNCSKRDTINVIITGTTPVSMFNADTVCLGDSTSFTDLSYCTFPDTINHWTWNFGDSAFSSIQNPEHLFSSPGIYNVQLTTAITSGCSQSAIKQVVVNAPSFAGFSADSSCINKPLQFINSSIIAPGDSVVLYSWDFGDVSPLSHLFEPVHTYLTASTYHVILTLNTSKGCSTGITKTVIIKPNLASPQQVILLTPAGGITFSDTLINFTWSPGTNAISYKFEIAPDSSFSTLIIARTLDTNATSVILTSQGLIFWRVIAYNFCNDSLISATDSLILFNPGRIPGLVLWLKSDSGVIASGNQVIQWNDFSNQNNNASQPVSSCQPSLFSHVINGMPAVKFNGINDYLILSNEINTRDFSFFIVAKPSSTVTDSSSGQVLLGSSTSYDALSIGFGDCVGNLFLSNETFSIARYNSSVVPGGVHGVGMTSNISGYYHIMNGNLSDTTNVSINLDGIDQPLIISSSGSFNDTTIYSLQKLTRIGNVASQSYFNGEIAEILVFDSSLTASEWIRTEDYLRGKYTAKPVNLGNDITNSDFCDSTMLDAGSRFSGFLWSTGDTTQTILVTHTGNYRVKVTDAFGNITLDSVNVLYPMANLKISDTTLCMGDSLIWSTGLNHNYTFRWQDNSTDSVLNIKNAGKYYYTAFDRRGCFVNSDTAIISIDSFAVQMTLGNDTTLCSGDFISPEGSSYPVQSYLWSDGSTGSTLVIATTGTYWLAASTINGCKARDTININIHGIAPTVNFYADSICDGSRTYFYDSSLTTDGSNIISYKWYFGSGSSINTKNAMHRFASNGIFPVTLVISTDSACSNSITKEITIHSLPVPDFSASGFCDNSNISFINTSIPADGSITSETWKFSDGFNSTDTNVVHLFDSSGTYTVALKVKSQFGCSDSITKNIFIKPSPVTAFSFSSPCYGELIYFSDNTSSPDLFPVIEWAWDFGDSSFSENSSPSHLYDTSGTFLVKFTTKSLNGCSASIYKSLTVTHFPIADFGNLNGCAGNSHSMADSSTCPDNNISSWQWFINNKYSSASENPVFSFADTGSCQVRLIVSTPAGCADTADKIIIVHPDPLISFTCLPAFGPVPLEINFQNESNALSYQWDFGDGNLSELENTSHIFADSGHYSVKLTGTSLYGCMDSLTKQIIAVVPLHDIAVFNVKATIINNFISVSADIANFGTLPENDIELILDLEGGNQIKEIWTGNLLSGQEITYNFSSLFEISENKSPSFVCVDAELVDNIDNVPSNNESCFVFNNSYLLFNPYPDPTSGAMNIEFILPFPGNPAIKLFNSEGKLIKSVFSGTLDAGFHRITFDVSDLPSGAYRYQIFFNNKEATKQFIKN